MNFGGLSGEYLQLITRVATLHDPLTMTLRGFAFFYKDNTHRRFGFENAGNAAERLSACLEQSFALDGPGGERITSLTSQYCSDSSFQNHLFISIKVSPINDALKMLELMILSVDNYKSWKMPRFRSLESVSVTGLRH
jgi:hypothetical protein